MPPDATSNNTKSPTPRLNPADRKKNQHYVFQAYLKPWSHKGQIWCLRSGEIFSPNLKGVACERFFYRTYPLTDEEREFVSKTMIEVEGTPELLRDTLHTFLDVYCLGHKVKASLKSSARTREHEQALDVLIEKGAEDWLAGIEDDFLPYLEQMREGKTEFYNDLKSAGVFIFGLCVQSVRTKQVREASLRVMGPEIRGRNTLHMMSVIAHLMAIRISHSLFRDRKSFKVEIIETESDTPFITTDQPVINLHGDADPAPPPPERLEFFYPLSPKRAMVFLEKGTSIPLRIGGIAVNNYNVIMAERSHEQILSNSKEYLESFAKIIGGVGSGNRLRSW
jgi:hypothetical protein